MHQQHFEQGNVYLEQNEWPKAIVEYSKAIELNPEFADAYANRAVAYFEWREYAGEGDCQYGQVIADYEKAVELNPFIELDIRLALAYVHRGECFFKNRKYDEAAADYAKELELDPLIKSRTPSTVYIDLIERDLHDQQYDRAIMYITKALAFKPEDTEYYYHKLAEAYHGRGIENFYCPEPDDAIADLSKAIELDPTNAEHYSGRAFIYSTLADYYWDKADYYWYQDEYQLFEEAVINLVDNNNKAIADFTKVIELAPERAEVYFKRGQCYAGNEDYIRAITDFTKAIELGREDWSVYFNRACAYKELGDKNKALADYRKTLALTEDDFIREQSLKYIEELESEGELKVHFSDVGQGDSILIDFGDIEVLIDGGGKSPGVVSYIDDYIDGVLEVIVATHPHADHIGGLIDVLAAFEVQGIWLNGDTSTSETYSQFMSAVNSEGAQVHEARRGDTIEVSDLAFNVLHPASLDDTINNNSIVLRLNYGEIDFLFMGDAEKEAEVSMLAAGVVPDIEILKVGHHGSRTSSSAQFLNAVNPEIAIYMAGEGNSYGHPHQETITALNEIGAEIYGTDIHGTIIVVTNGTI